MKGKVQAQRKFAQRRVVNQPTATAISYTSNERRPVVESNDRSANIYNNNTSASRLLDKVAFRHPGMHNGRFIENPQLKIELVKLPESISKRESVILPSTSGGTIQNSLLDRECQCVDKHQNTYFLRSRSQFKTKTKKIELNKAISTKRGRPRNSSLPRLTKRKRSRTPIINDTSSEDEIPLSTYSRKIRKITTLDVRRSKVRNTETLNDNAVFMDTSENPADRPDPIPHNLFADYDSNMEPLVYEPDVEVGNNDEDNVILDTPPTRTLIPDNQEENHVNVHAIVTVCGDISEEEHSVFNPSSLPIRENNEGEHADIETITLSNEDSDDGNNPMKSPTGESDDEYEDDLFIRECIERLDDISDFPNLGTEEIRVHDTDVQFIKEEDGQLTPKEESRQVRAGPSRPAGVIVEAPVLYPTKEEFNDPLVFYDKIQSVAMNYGICKVVPPEGFETKCSLKNLTRVAASHQYIGRLFKRWSTGTREMCAIRAHLASHSVVFTRPPLIDGLEVDLPKMFQTVQKYGGFLEVSQKQLWNRVAEDMNYFNILNPGKRLDHLYVKYLLPYDIMKPEDREMLHSKLECLWQKKYHKLLKLARNPLCFEKTILGESDSSSDEDYTEEEEKLNKAMYEIPNNDKSTRPILVTNFQKINDNALRIFFAQNPQGPSVEEVEELYWSKVLQAIDHICIYTADVDTTDGGRGFSTEDVDIISKHKWNLKNFQHNEANILKALGPAISVTTPVLHMGMLFSTHCWHKDPHGLPWVEYHHEGKPKIWYGIPDIRSYKFRKTVEKLCPTVVQDKSLWLSSDVLMIPPNLLLNDGISLTKTIQQPGEYVFVMPNSYTSSICTGLTISESVYFAVESWLNNINDIFIKLHECCEPMIFPPEQLFIALGTDPKSSPNVLRRIYSHLINALEGELAARFILDNLGIVQEIAEPSDDQQINWNCKEKECDICRRPLYLSKIMGRFRQKAVTKMCINHYKEIVERNKCEDWSITLVLFISDEYIRTLTEDFTKKLKTH